MANLQSDLAEAVVKSFSFLCQGATHTIDKSESIGRLDAICFTIPDAGELLGTSGTPPDSPSR